MDTLIFRGTNFHGRQAHARRSRDRDQSDVEASFGLNFCMGWDPPGKREKNMDGDSAKNSRVVHIPSIPSYSVRVDHDPMPISSYFIRWIMLTHGDSDAIQQTRKSSRNMFHCYEQTWDKRWDSANQTKEVKLLMSLKFPLVDDFRGLKLPLSDDRWYTSHRPKTYFSPKGHYWVKHH